MGLFQSAIVIILTFVIFHPAPGQSDIVSLGARAQAMGNASVALKDDFAPFNNIGATSQMGEITLVTSFSYKFGFVPFQHTGAGIAYPTKTGVFALTIRKFGATLYNEQHVGLGFSNKLGIASLGVKLNYTQYTILEMGTKGVPHIELGGVVEISPILFLGAHIYNLAQARLSDDAELFLPIILRSGISYLPSEALTICFSVEKNLERDTRLNGGLEYQFLEKFRLRSGMSSAPFQQYYGLGFSPYNFSFDYALENHGILGLSHQVSLTYKLLNRRTL